MKIYETKIRPAKPAEEYKVVKNLQCDLCGVQGGDENYRNEQDWRKNCYDSQTRNTKVWMETGNNYGADGGDAKITSFDICTDCFKNKLVPWMQSQGATPFEEERDW